MGKISGVAKELTKIAAGVLKDNGLPKAEEIRRPYYNMSDGIGSLERVLKNLGDKELLAKFNAIVKAESELYKLLNSKYNWD
jgi:hypothetical protein